MVPQDKENHDVTGWSIDKVETINDLKIEWSMTDPSHLNLTVRLCNYDKKTKECHLDILR